MTTTTYSQRTARAADIEGVVRRLERLTAECGAIAVVLRRTIAPLDTAEHDLDRRLFGHLAATAVEIRDWPSTTAAEIRLQLDAWQRKREAEERQAGEGAP